MAGKDQLEEARKLWEKALGRVLTLEQTRTIIENVVRLYDVLDGWAKDDRETVECGSGEDETE